MNPDTALFKKRDCFFVEGRFETKVEYGFQRTTPVACEHVYLMCSISTLGVALLGLSDGKAKNINRAFSLVINNGRFLDDAFHCRLIVQGDASTRTDTLEVKKEAMGRSLQYTTRRMRITC